MFRWSAFFVLSAIFLGIAEVAYARPVTYAGGWLLMSNNDKKASSNTINYSISARQAVGLRVDYMRESNSKLYMALYNRLLKRWNGADSQANIFLMTGVGAVDYQGKTSGAGMVGIELDWEDRRFYVAYEGRYMHAGKAEKGFSQMGRVGLAPYVADYDSVHTWLMIQVDHRPYEHDDIVVTPFVRLFTDDVLGEVGISDKGDMMLNGRVNF